MVAESPDDVCDISLRDAAQPVKRPVLTTKFEPAKIPSKVESVKIPAKVESVKIPGKIPQKVESVKILAKGEPVKIPAKVDSVTLSSITESAKGYAKIDPAKVSSKIEPAKVPAKISDKHTVNDNSVKSVTYGNTANKPAISVKPALNCNAGNGNNNSNNTKWRLKCQTSGDVRLKKYQFGDKENDKSFNSKFRSPNPPD